MQTFSGAALSLSLTEELTRKLRQLAESCGATLYVTLLAAFKALLARYSGQTDILVGSPAAGRFRAELAGQVGYFVNPLALRPTYPETHPSPRWWIAFAGPSLPASITALSLFPGLSSACSRHEMPAARQSFSPGSCCRKRLLERAWTLGGSPYARRGLPCR